MHGQHGLRWSHLFFLAFVFVLGIFVPLSWHRQHGRHPIEPLSGRTRVDRQMDAIEVLSNRKGSAWKLHSLADHSQGMGSHFRGTSFRRMSNVADPAPRYQQSAWPAAHMVMKRLELLEQSQDTCSWAQNVRKQLTALHHCKSLTSEAVPHIFARLQNAIDTVPDLSLAVGQNEKSYQLNAIRYDLKRRLDIWRSAHELSNTFPQSVLATEQPFYGASLLKESRSSGEPDFCLLELSGLLAAMEQYEFSRLSGDGAIIAHVIDPLLNSENDAQRSLGKAIDLHYRNANLRLVATSDMMNRLLPTTSDQLSRIDDTIVGVPVWGNSRTRTSLRTRLIPDPHRIRIGMEAWGYVFSDTVASSRNIYLYNEGETAFLVRKLILIDQQGVKAKPTVAEAISESELIDVETNYDNIPFVGSWVRSVARRKHAEGHDRALSETEYRVASQARQTFDRELDPRLHRGIDGFYHELWKPLDRLGLEPTAVQLSTTEERATGRLRIGHSTQITAYSARPRALSNSMLSMQFHESAINNGLDQLGLAGQTFSLHNLYLHVRKKLGQPLAEVPDSMPKKVVVTFNINDPIRVRCDNDKVTLTMSLKQISKGSRYKWSNLRISAEYGIESDGIQAFLVRQNSVRLEGKKLRTRDQIALRGVFSKMLSRGNQVPMVPKKIAENPRMADLVVTQQRIKDGWIGLAIGPRDMRAMVSQHGPQTRTR